jgi:hypothetical protein
LVWLRLTRAGFILRHFISSNGMLIYTVLYFDEENLKNIAEKDRLPKCLNFEFSDLLSLEPVDDTLRPLRLNTRLWHHH